MDYLNGQSNGIRHRDGDYGEIGGLDSCSVTQDRYPAAWSEKQNQGQVAMLFACLQHVRAELETRFDCYHPAWTILTRVAAVEPVVASALAIET